MFLRASQWAEKRSWNLEMRLIEFQVKAASFVGCLFSGILHFIPCHSASQQVYGDPATHHVLWEVGGRWGSPCPWTIQRDLQSALGKLPHQVQREAWKGAAGQHLCSSFWLSVTIGTKMVRCLWTERSFIWKPFRVPKKQSFSTWAVYSRQAWPRRTNSAGGYRG